MSRNPVTGFAAVIVLTLGALSPVAAEEIPASLRACALEKNDAERLKCFDRELARIPAPQSAQGQAAAPPATMQTPEERFGRAGPLARVETDREKAATPTVSELTATVVSLSQRAHGEIVMKLDNGQVWSQTMFDSHFSVRANDQITIRAGALGSYTAAAPSGRTTKVMRLR